MNYIIAFLAMVGFWWLGIVGGFFLMVIFKDGECRKLWREKGIDALIPFL